MNCIDVFIQQVKIKSKEMAIFIPHQESTTFEELYNLSKKSQSFYRSFGILPGMSVLLLDNLSSRLYASIIGLLSMGVTVILVEPWMPIDHIQKAIQIAKPMAFISNKIGMLWGVRVEAIRQIPRWILASKMDSVSSFQSVLNIESVDPDLPGIISFTSGTTGKPKGVIRSQSYLVKQHEVLSQHLGSQKLQGPDLCIFANFVLSNLASGRGSIVVPPTWKQKVLRELDQLPLKFRPESLTSGPGFLLKLLDNSLLPSLRSIHIGGALTDCWIFEKGFRRWPDAYWEHIYGGSEVEPVTMVDARLAVKESRERNFFQTLFLGKNVPEISTQVELTGLWVAGPHVCPEYLGNSEENKAVKKKDESGILWHFMGDRILESENGWWYHGRSNQTPEDFLLEQRIYQKLQSSRSFIFNSTSLSHKYLLGEEILPHKQDLLAEFPELDGILEIQIYRDHRHRARLDRKKILEKGPKWLVGPSI